MKILTGLAFLLAIGCSAMAPPKPARIEVLSAGYLVDGAPVASSRDLKAYLARHGIREVQVIPRPEASSARVHETLSAVREAGVSIGQ